MDDELILLDDEQPDLLIAENEDNFYKGDPFRYSDFTPEQLEALKVKGDPGRGIASIDLTNTTGKVKTYTITFTDDTTTTFTVVDGNDGASPEITFVGTTIYVNGVAGPDLKGATGKSAYQSYVDTTTDNPVLSEADWSKVRAYKQVESAATSGTITIETNTVTVLTTELTNSHTLTITQGALISSFANEFVLMFRTGASAPSITFTPPSGVTYIWAGGAAPTIALSKSYLISFLRFTDTVYFVNYVELDNL